MKFTDEPIEREVIPIQSMSEPKLDKRGRTQAEKDDLKKIIKGFSYEDYEEVVKLLPSECMWNELFKRNTNMLHRINQIEEALGVSMDNVMPISIDTWNEVKKRYEDMIL